MAGRTPPPGHMRAGSSLRAVFFHVEMFALKRQWGGLTGAVPGGDPAGTPELISVVYGRPAGRLCHSPGYSLPSAGTAAGGTRGGPVVPVTSNTAGTDMLTNSH